MLPFLPLKKGDRHDFGSPLADDGPIDKPLAVFSAFPDLTELIKMRHGNFGLADLYG